VLTVAKIAGSGAAAYGQYLEGRTVAVGAGDYYLAADGERVEAPGRWAGLGSVGMDALGVENAAAAVRAEQFQALMAVQNPATGGRLRAGGAGGSSVAAIDATFSAPKSVSAVWALASPELRAGIELAQERAVDAALAHAVEFVPMVRRRVDREMVLREIPGELIATSWRHTTARAVAGRAPDPQLHSHVVLHGAVRADDGKVVAIESRAWLVHQREVGAAYRAQLARELGRLGFAVEAGTGRGGRYFELAGVPQGLIEEWSGRHRQVQQQIQRRLTERIAGLQAQVDAGGPDADGAQVRLVALQRSGQLMPAEQRAVAMRTRSAKGSGGAMLETAGDLDRAWYDAAREHDFDARSVEALRNPWLHLDHRGALTEDQLEKRILTRLTEFDATFAPREARAVALEATAGGDPAAGLAALERLAERREILELADGRQTTRSHRGTERAAVTAADGLADATAEPIAAELVDDELSELRSELALGGAQLAVEQEQAIRVACSDQQLVVIVGQAGTGKSTALTAVARAHQEAGQKIVVTSTGAQAAERLAAEFSQAGVSKVAGCSTRALQAAVRRGTVTLSPGVTVIHDEAALASTREQAWLLQAVAESGARLIEVGDPRQSQAVGAGGLWPQIEAAAGEQGGLVELSRIVRAKDAADRRDQARWRAGMHDQALAGYATRGRVTVADTQRQAEDEALENAHADRQAGKTALVVVQTSNDALDGLNARAQALRIQDGLLTGEQEIALAGRPYGLYGGDEIVLRAASTHPGLGAVRNGTRGTVLDVADDDEHATLRLADGREAVWERAQLDAASARLSYVSHTFPAQGQTVDRAHVIAGEHADANGTYVALTRARESTRIYASVERLSPGDEPAGVLSDRQALVEALAGQLGREEVELPSIAVALAHERHVEAEVDRESEPVDDDDVAEPQRRAERDELDERRQERDRLRAIVDSYPTEAAREIDRLWQAGIQEREAADGDTERAAHWQGVYDDLGVLRRRGTEGREIHDRAEQFTVRAEQQQRHADQLAAQAWALADGPEGPAAWEQAHPAVREQLHSAETALAAAVDQRVVWERSGPAAGVSEPFDPGTAHQQVAWLDAERDRLKAQLRGYPRQHARDAEHADQQAKLADRSAQAARERAMEAGQEREQLGRLARRGRRGSDALERQHAFQEQAERHDQRAETERQTAREAREQPGGPVEWDRSHPGVRERLSIYEHALEVASEQQARRLLASDPTIAVRVFGPRPRTPAQRTIWDRGAQAISRYRAAHHITSQDTVLGAEPDSGAPNGFQRHADWKHAAELALQARRELGVDSSRDRGSVAEQARQVPELTPPPPELDRGLDRDRGFGY
jgi:conjugative relaxase-like TrwC/TraI family protein